MIELIQSLPTLQRLALAYAPAQARDATLSLLALDARLAGALRTASEPMLAQIKLAWWRDMLKRQPADRPQGEPLLEALAVWQGEEPALIALIDAWEQLVTQEVLTEDDMHAFCSGRGAAFAALARIAGKPDRSEAAQRAGEGWALADLASSLQAPQERDAALSVLRSHDWQHIPLPRALRPLAVMHGLGARAAREGQGLDRPSPGTFLVAVRIGLLGR